MSDLTELDDRLLATVISGPLTYNETIEFSGTRAVAFIMGTGGTNGIIGFRNTSTSVNDYVTRGSNITVTSNSGKFSFTNNTDNVLGQYIVLVS